MIALEDIYRQEKPKVSCVKKELTHLLNHELPEINHIFKKYIF